MARFLILSMLRDLSGGNDPAGTQVLALTSDTAMSGAAVLQAWDNKNPASISQRLFALDISGAVVYDVDVAPAPPVRQVSPVPAGEAALSLPAFNPAA